MERFTIKELDTILSVLNDKLLLILDEEEEYKDKLNEAKFYKNEAHIRCYEEELEKRLKEYDEILDLTIKISEEIE